MSVLVNYNGLRVGRLVYQDHRIFFEYDADFLKKGWELSPFKLPLKSGVFSCEDLLFDGLFGVFNDSLPDGWGRLLLDRKLMQLGRNPDELTPLDRLCFVGKRGMGALSYEPEIAGGEAHIHYDLDLIENEILQVQMENGEQFVDDLLIMNGSSAGARPKILVSITDHSYQATDNQHLNSDWIVKFRSSLDPSDVGSIEYAYHLMAKASGLDVPEARLFPSKKSTGFFGVKRFDRTSLELIHMHTVSGLIHADHRIPSLTYETLLKMTGWLTKDIAEVEKQFRHAVFNVLSHNRDDHAKNFSFLMDANGEWRVSPAYDLIFSSGPAGEHCTTVMKEGKNPKAQHFLQLAERVGFDHNRAIEIIEEVKEGISQFTRFAEEAQMSQKSMDHIQKFLKSVQHNFY